MVIPLYQLFKVKVNRGSRDITRVIGECRDQGPSYKALGLLSPAPVILLLFTSDLTLIQPTSSMRSLGLLLVLGLISLSLASIPASVMLEDLRDRNPEIFQHQDFKAFDSKRVYDGFWVRKFEVPINK